MTDSESEDPSEPTDVESPYTQDGVEVHTVIADCMHCEGYELTAQAEWNSVSGQNCYIEITRYSDSIPHKLERRNIAFEVKKVIDQLGVEAEDTDTETETE